MTTLLRVPPWPVARKAQRVSNAYESEIVVHQHLATVDLSMLRVCLFATWAYIPNRWRRRGRACQVEVVPRSALRVFNLSHFKGLSPNVAAVIAGELVLLQITISNHYELRYRQLVDHGRAHR
jgi:hypothetical protein